MSNLEALAGLVSGLWPLSQLGTPVAFANPAPDILALWAALVMKTRTFGKLRTRAGDTAYRSTGRAKTSGVHSHAMQV